MLCPLSIPKLVLLPAEVPYYILSEFPFPSPVEDILKQLLGVTKLETHLMAQTASLLKELLLSTLTLIVA